MGSGEIQKLNSLRLSSSEMWKDNGMDIFSKSFREDDDDDEESLKWASIQRLPTTVRLRKGILVEEEGGHNLIREVDVKKLGPLERKTVLDRLVKFAEEDHEKFLLKLKDRIERY